jgi:phenolic acid decarboxylase
MKSVFVKTLSAASILLSLNACGQTATSPKTTGTHLYIDVHQLEPGKVKFEDVAGAHAKDLEVQKKYGVNFIKYWVDEQKGLVYCLSSTSDSSAIRKTHKEAHGLLPQHIYPVTDGMEAALNGKGNFFLDVHYLGAGKVTAKDVAGAHQKDLAAQGKYGVNFINYWVNEQEGVVMCLSQAKDSTSVIETHKEAHGLLPAYVLKVKQGQ